MKRTMDKILIVLALFLLAFICVMLWLYYKTGAIPDTLCTCVFTVCGGECGVMGWIKTTKERTKEREYQLEDRKSEQIRDRAIPEPSEDPMEKEKSQNESVG